MPTTSARIAIVPDAEAVIRELYRIQADHDLAGATGGRVLTTIADRVNVVAIHFPNVVTAAGIEDVYGWTVATDPNLPTGVLVYQPGRLTITVRERGDVDLPLLAAQARRTAAKALRAKVLETVHAIGLPSFRAFAYPAGVTR